MSRGQGAEGCPTSAPCSFFIGSSIPKTSQMRLISIRKSVFGRATVVLVFAQAVGGCYSMAPIEGATPAPGNDVRLQLSDQGSVQLAPLIGPRIGAIDGRAMESSDSALVVAVQAVVAQSGRSMAWSMERLSVPRSAVSHVSTRKLDTRKTWIAAGLTVLGALVVGSVFGLGNGFDGLLGGGSGGGGKQ